MKIRLFKKTGTGFLVAALAAILVSGGILAACSRATPTTTSAPAATTTSTPATTTSPRPATATTTAPAPATTAAPGPTAPAGPSAADFYRDNVARIIVPYGPGGTSDMYARLIANYWTEVTGGRMIVENKS
ncbi:MAG: hypothetical protein Q8R28_12890, partial [Dehalococcoidia bacterium]|nr:hypothetical protein [Dehalococcoidia bacterium]